MQCLTQEVEKLSVSVVYYLIFNGTSWQIKTLGHFGVARELGRVSNFSLPFNQSIKRPAHERSR